MIRRILVVLGVIFLVVAAVVITSWSAAPGGPPAGPDGGTTAPDGAAEPDDAPAGIPAPPGAETFEVVDVVDGDTLRLRDDTGAVESVRLVGIDTPEVYPEYECFGDEAEDELRRLAPIGGTVLGAVDEDPFDDYDRLLLYLWSDDGVFVNLALVEGGYAEAIRVAPNDAHYDVLLDAEHAASRAGLGMWGAC